MLSERAERSEASEAPPLTHTETQDREPNNMFGHRASRAKQGERGASPLTHAETKTESRIKAPKPLSVRVPSWDNFHE